MISVITPGWDSNFINKIKVGTRTRQHSKIVACFKIDFLHGNSVGYFNSYLMDGFGIEIAGSFPIRGKSF